MRDLAAKLMESEQIKEITQAYSNLWRPLRWERMRSGLSDSAVWRLETPAGQVALRRWAPAFTLDRIETVHRVLARARGLGIECVPEPVWNLQGDSIVSRDGWLWEMCRWMPGEPVTGEAMTDTALRNVMICLARWHQTMVPQQLVLSGVTALPGLAPFLAGICVPCPAVVRRRSEWLRLNAVIGENVKPRSVTLRERFERTLDVIERWRTPLVAWLSREVPVVPLRLCLRDIHAEHVLLTGDTVTGLIDFGAIGLDSPACDLARLLGSYFPDRSSNATAAQRWEQAIAEYVALVPLSEQETRLAIDLDWTGTVISVLRWADWLARPGRTMENPTTAVARWDTLLQRLEQMTPGYPTASSMIR